MNPEMQANHYDADVVIVGYGPSGVIAANTLASRDVSVIAFERDKDIYPRARAVTVNDWTLRILQDLDLDQELLNVIDPQRALRWVTYEGEELMRVSFTPSTLGTVEGTRFYNVYQPAMEPILRAGGDRYPDLLDVQYGWEVIEVSQDDHGATVVAKQRHTDELKTVRAKYVIAADGGSSPTRHALDMEFLGDTQEVEWVIIDCKVKRWWPDRDYLTFWSDKARPVVDLPLPMGNHRWEIPLQPTESPADFRTEEQLWPLLEDMGVTRDDVEIFQHAFYKHHVRAAKDWREGRVFLVGDAAHLMPPWAGAGMQSGMRDAYDIGWKLARVLKDESPEELLDTYEVERRPNVEFYTQLAVHLGQVIKQELSDEELAAATAPPPPGQEHVDPPLIAPPVLQDGWLRGTVDDDSIIGRMVPQPTVITAEGWMLKLDDAIGRTYALLGDGVDPKSALTEDELAGWESLGTKFITLRQREDGTEDSDEIVDIHGVVTDWMREFGVKVIAVRPDRFVAAADTKGLARPDLPAR